MMAFSSLDKDAQASPQECKFDTDSRPLLVDNGSSHCMSLVKGDFVNLKPLKQDEVCILGLMAGHSPEAVGTMVINILDDDGQAH